MFKRIFKSILIINICLSNIISHGAISVSDGSAFVTKAEFSADLNNLSNRMAQLENSLDSKIDSLVSTYLKRNGIWNGAKQTIMKDDVVDFWSVNSLTTAQGAHWDWKSLMSTGTLNYGVEYLLRNQNFDFITHSSKSGMMIGKVDVITGYDMAKKMVPTSSGTDKRNFAYFESSTTTNNPVFSVGSSLTFYNNGNEVSRCVPVSMGQEKYGAQASTMNYSSLRIMPASQTFNPVFFVNKDDTITINYKLSFTCQTYDAQETWKNLTTLCVGSFPGVAMVFGDFYIY